jgi:hypothetical protein
LPQQALVGRPGKDQVRRWYRPFWELARSSQICGSTPRERGRDGDGPADPSSALSRLTASIFISAPPPHPPLVAWNC